MKEVRRRSLELGLGPDAVVQSFSEQCETDTEDKSDTKAITASVTRFGDTGLYSVSQAVRAGRRWATGPRSLGSG